MEVMEEEANEEERIEIEFEGWDFGMILQVECCVDVEYRHSILFCK